MTLHVLYLAHDLADPAIRRRVLMLATGGAQVTVAGFQRADSVLAENPEITTITLGRTADGKFGQRIRAVAKARMSLKRLLGPISPPDIVLARNLEMLALAGRAASIFGQRIPIVYECLDIHRLLLNTGPKGRAMRLAERFFGRKASLLITSSPAFVRNYFKPLSGLQLPVLLLENKVLDLNPLPDYQMPIPRPPAPGMPWRIGWFGAIRCRKSLQILTDFAARMNGSVQIVLRGRPALGEFDDFHALVTAAPHIDFHGAYRNPEDLSAIYEDVQFSWAIDFFEEGLNSDWLLPNRLYEGGLHGAVPIALASTETGRFVESNNAGLTLQRAAVDELATFFEGMTEARYAALFANLSLIERGQFVVGPAECRVLVDQLAGLDDTVRPPAPLPPTSVTQY